MEVRTQGVRIFMLAAILFARVHAQVAWSSRDGGLPSVFKGVLRGPSCFSVGYDSVAQDLLETPQRPTLVRKTERL